MQKLSPTKSIQDKHWIKTTGMAKNKLLEELVCKLSAYQLNNWFKTTGGTEKPVVGQPLLWRNKSKNGCNGPQIKHMSHWVRKKLIVLCWMKSGSTAGTDERRWNCYLTRTKMIQIWWFKTIVGCELQISSKSGVHGCCCMAKWRAQLWWKDQSDLCCRRKGLQEELPSQKYLLWQDRTEWDGQMNVERFCIWWNLTLMKSVANNLCMCYKQGSKSIMCTNDMHHKDVKFKDSLLLHVHHGEGTKHMSDVTCNSGFMRQHMILIGAKIREKMHFVPNKKPIYLIMDNAGGHGTKDTIEKCVNVLRKIHNIIVLWQIPQSPKKNLLDLGIWKSL